MDHDMTTQEDVLIEDVDTNDLDFPMPSINEVGWLLVGGGVVSLIVTLMRKRRGILDVAVPLGLMGLGSGVLLQERQTNMEEAEGNILAELDALDPVARAQVLKAVAKEEFGRIPGVGK